MTKKTNGDNVEISAEKDSIMPSVVKPGRGG